MKCILLAGGSGGSKWPLSRKNYPIQFAEIREGRSIFQENIARHLPYCDEFYIFTNRKYEHIVKGQLEVFQELKYKLFLESEAINTTLPIIIGLMYAGKRENVLVIGCNSIYSGEGFRECIMEGIELLKNSVCVLFGMPVTEKSTSIGYIKYIENDVELFMEKPSVKLIDNLMESGDWLCNTGKYIINVERFLEVLKNEFSIIYNNAKNAYMDCSEHNGDINIPQGYKTKILNDSFERCIISNLSNAKVIPLRNVEWNIINSWQSIEKSIKADALSDVVKKDCNNVTIINNADNKLVVANGISDTVIVNTDDAIYIEGKAAVEDIKGFFHGNDYQDYDYINYNNSRYRAWGKYKVLNKGYGYIIKEVIIYPGKEMSLHKHRYRSEHWAVVEGTVEITIDNNIANYKPNTSVFVPEGSYHRIANRTNKNIVIIETEIGKYINEGDIISKNYMSENYTNYKPVKLKPIFKDYLWGGTKLRDEWNKDCDWDIIAESWELSTHKAGNSIIDSGMFEGMPFGEYINKYGNDVVGWKCKAFNEFPILIKLIDSKQPLSVQVHPDDDFAMSVENEYGKNEMWYIIDCDKDSFIYCGFNKKITASEFIECIKNKTITDVLNKIKVKKGESYFIPAGTVHAIGKGILICEIQQNSNSTYRIYDYDRKDKNGNTRELHIEKAVKVVNFDKYTQCLDSSKEVCDDYGNKYKNLCACKYFDVSVMEINEKAEICVDRSSFMSLVTVEGEGSICVEKEEYLMKKGDTFFIPAGIGNISIKGYCKVILTHI